MKCTTADMCIISLPRCTFIDDICATHNCQSALHVLAPPSPLAPTSPFLIVNLRTHTHARPLFPFSQYMDNQAEAYQQHGAKAFQVPLTAKPRLYDALLDSSHTLPRTPYIKGERLQGRGIELVVLGDKEEAMKTLFEISDGSPRYGHGSYDPLEKIWRWMPAEMGPHEQAKGMIEGLRERVKEEGDMVFYVVSERVERMEECMVERMGGGECMPCLPCSRRRRAKLPLSDTPLYPPPPPPLCHLDYKNTKHKTKIIPPSFTPA